MCDLDLLQAEDVDLVPVEVRFERAVVLPDLSVPSQAATFHEESSSASISYSSRANTARQGGKRVVSPRSAPLN